MPSWKAVQSRKKIHKKTKLALIALGLILLLLAAAQIFRFTKVISSPWNMSSKSQPLTGWNGRFNINLVILSQSISLVSFNPKEQKIVTIKVPDETYLDVAEGFGKWQLRSVHDLGGSQLLKQTLSGFFGIPIDGFMEVSSLDDLLSKNPISSFNLLSKLKTDLTLGQLIRLKIGLASVRFDKIIELDLVNTNVLDRTTLLDGSQVYMADPLRLDSILTDLADPSLSMEQKTIAIFNATDHPQLAQKAARLISNLGGNVIITSNAKVRLEKTQAVGEESATLERVKQIFGRGDTIDASDEDLTSSRAQINLFLGEDYFELK